MVGLFRDEACQVRFESPNLVVGEVLAEEPDELLDHARVLNYGHRGKKPRDATGKVAELTSNIGVKVDAQQGTSNGFINRKI